MHYYIVFEGDMKNEYISESYYELYEKTPTIEELIHFADNLTKITSTEGVVFYILKYRTRFPLVSQVYTCFTNTSVVEMINTITGGV